MHGERWKLIETPQHDVVDIQRNEKQVQLANAILLPTPETMNQKHDRNFLFWYSNKVLF